MPHPKVRKAVIPAAGLGTRFLPATKALPKEMIPLVDKPLIQYAVEEAVASGIEQVIVVTGRGKGTLEDHFDRAPELEAELAARGKTAELAEVRAVASLARLAYVRQTEALGLGHAVLQARTLVGDEPFAVFLPDDLVLARVPCMSQLLDVHARTGTSVIAIEPVDPEATSSYGIIAGDEVEPGLYRIRDLVEKPRPVDAPSNLGIIGRYVLTPGIFACIEETPRGAGGEIQLTDALRRLRASEPLHALRFEGRRHDAGNKLGFLKATFELALERPDLGKPLREWLLKLGL